MEVIALLLIAVAVIYFQSSVFNGLALHKLEYTCGFSAKEAHEGDELFLVEVINNRKLLPVPWLKVDIHSSRWLDFAETSSVVTQDNRRVTSTFYLRGHQRITRRWRLKCLKRGVFTTENVTLVWGDALGFYTSSAPKRVNAKLTVYPEVINLEELFVPANYMQGDMLVKRWVVDDPFIVSGAREYAPGDPMNRIHWSATAREAKLMVRKNDFTSRMSLTVMLNIQTDEGEYVDVLDRSAAELGIKVAATLVDRALRVGAPLRFCTNGCVLGDERSMVFTSEASGQEHASEILGLLARMMMKSTKDFENYLEETYSRLEASDVVIVTSYINRQVCNYARLLLKRRNTVKIILTSKFIVSAELPGDLDIYILPGGDANAEGRPA